MFRLSAIYIAADLLMKGMGLILLPVYTRYLTTSDYGVMSVATVVGTIAGTVLSLGLGGAALKFYYDYEGRERRELYGTLWLFLIVVPGVAFLGIEIFAADLLDAAFRQVPYSPYLRIALWTAYVNIAFATVPKEMFRASEQATHYSGLNLVQFLVTAVVAIVLVVGYDQGAAGALRGRLWGTIAVAILASVAMRRAARVAMRKDILRRALLYSTPLVPHYLSHWVLTASDRVILERYVDMSEVGLYALGYQIGGVLSLIAIAANNAIIPAFGKLDTRDPEAVGRVMHIVTWFVVVCTFVAIGLAIFGGDVIALLTPPSYHAAAVVVPWVVLGYVFMALYFPSIDVINLLLADTKKIALCTTIAAATNIGLNLVFIPHYGIMAAAITTAASYLVLCVSLGYFARRGLRLPFEFKRMGLVLMAGAATVAVGLLPDAGLTVQNVGLRILSILVFPALLWATGFLNAGELRWLRTVIASRGRRKASAEAREDTEE